jgi:hypothetical protein
MGLFGPDSEPAKLLRFFNIRLKLKIGSYAQDYYPVREIVRFMAKP